MNFISTISYKEFTNGILSYLIYGLLVFLISIPIAFTYFPLPHTTFSGSILLLCIYGLQIYCRIQIGNPNIDFRKAVLAYFAYIVLLAICISHIFSVFHLKDVFKASLFSGSTLSIAYLYGKYTNSDLTEIGQAARAAIFTASILCLINAFFIGIHLVFIAFYVVLLLAIPFTMAAFSQYFHTLYYQASDHERQRLQIVAALYILVNFINLTMVILELFFNKKRRSE